MGKQINGMKMGQYVPGCSVIHKLDPRTKIIGCLVIVMTVLLRTDWLVTTLDLGLLTGGFLLAEVRLSRLLRRLRGLWLLLLLSFMFQAVLKPGEPLWQTDWLTVTKEGVILGASTVLRLLILLFGSLLLTMTTTPLKLAAGLEALCSPLERVGVPVHKFAMLISISLRFIPTINEEAEWIARAQRSRGAPLDSKNVIVRVKSMSAILIPLLASSLQRAHDLAVAMESRCYTGGAHPVRMEGLWFRKADGFSLAVVAIPFLVSVGLV